MAIVIIYTLKAYVRVNAKTPECLSYMLDTINYYNCSNKGGIDGKDNLVRG